LGENAACPIVFGGVLSALVGKHLVHVCESRALCI
jgi:hypothetical protein